MILANSPWADRYHLLLAFPVDLHAGQFSFFSHHGEPMSMLAFVNDALMAVFFFVIGLEIKQEVLIGELSSLRKALLPIVAASQSVKGKPEEREFLLSVPAKEVLDSTSDDHVLMQGVIDLMADANGKICEFLHPSLQHGSDTILKAMNRHYLTGMYREFVDHARKKVPHIHIGTDLIIGFPGETDELFEESFAFVKSIGFSNMHLFPFSPREGTRAACMTPRVPGDRVEKRIVRLHKLAEEMSAAFRSSLIGSMQTVIPEECTGDSGTGWTGSYVRTRVRRKGLHPGELIRTVISGMDDSGILSGC